MSFKIIWNSFLINSMSLMNLQEILKISIASHNFYGQSKFFTSHIQIQIPLKMNFEQLEYNMHNYTTKCTKLKFK
jgi:hypothetical protein